MIEAVERAMRDGDNGYAPSAGILKAREAVAAECVGRGMPMHPDRVVITSGTSEGIELALTALAGPGDEVLIPVPTYPLYTAVLAKIGARAVFYRTDEQRGWQPDVDHIQRLISPATRALVVIDPNNPTGATYSIAGAARAGRPRLAAQLSPAGRRGVRRSGLRRTDSSDRGAQPGCTGHHVFIAVESLPGPRLESRMARRRAHRSTRRGAGGHQETC